MTAPSLPHACEAMVLAVEREEIPIAYSGKFREYGLRIGDGRARQLLVYCPFCGHKLPESLRDLYFDRLDEMRMDPDSLDLPLQYRTDAWWRSELEGSEAGGSA